ncbi:MAG: motility associated factor glycosyltransferase family protein [Gammaproteobacteria bacterium]|nr:motility associated factor glycosyltransferase family protein [Gammaproteobacteria bacterium]
MSQSKSNKVTTNIFGDTYLPSINGKKFEEIAYSTYFDIDILDKLSKEFTFYIFIGTDSGMMLNHLKQLNIDPSSIYLFIEDIEILNKLHKNKLTNENLNATQDNIIISSIDKWQETAKKADIIKFIEVKRVEVIKSFSAQDQTYPAYTQITKQLHDDINQLKWNHPDKFQKKIYIQNQIENCAYNIRPAIELKGQFKGKPALILAGGPSLDNYIDWIEEHKTNYIIIAVSRVARRLLSTSIVPDIFITADPFESAYTTSKEVLAFSDKSILVHQAYAHPKLVGQWQGQQFYFGKLLPWETEYNPENIKGIGPTVTNAAIHLALQMGITDQILLGVDLCYSIEGYSHVSETIERDKGADLGFSGILVYTNKGGQANTTYEMLEARISISLLAELAEKQGGKISNPTPSSAQIEHVSHIPLTALPSVGVNSFTQCNQISNEQKFQHYEKTINEYKIIKNKVGQIQQYANDIINICSIEYEEKNKNTKHLNKILDLENNLNNFTDIITIIESFGINGYYNFIHPDKIKTTKTELDSITRYYNSLYISCDVFLNSLNDASKTIETYLKKPSKQESPNNNSEFVKVNNQEKIINEEEVIRLDDLEKKLYHLFQLDNKDMIQQAIQQLRLVSSEKATSFSNLAQGYLFELEGNNNQAINEYLNANHEQTLESGLKRILEITLKNRDIENTIAVLKALSDISSTYLIQLANLYQVSEQYKDALDAYSHYIDKNPDDIFILIKLGLLYLSLDITEGATFVFKRVLDLDSNNMSALTYLNFIKSSTYSCINSTNDITIIKENIIELEQYFFKQSLNENNLDIDRLEKAKKHRTIGFIATKSLLENKVFKTFINNLYQHFKFMNFTIFYFDNKIKYQLRSFFEKNTSRIKFCKPNNIYEIVENIEIYINNVESNCTKDNLYILKLINSVNTLIVDYCMNIFPLPYYNKFVNETLEDASIRSLNHKFMRKYKKMGISDTDLKTEDYHFWNLYIQAALKHNNSSTNTNKFIYNKKELRYFKVIELASNNKNFINYKYIFHKRMTKLQ